MPQDLQGNRQLRPTSVTSASELGTGGEGGPRLSALRQSMPEPLARKILSTRGHIEGERKQVTVLFTDIVDSTALAEQMDPEEWGTIVNGAHELVTQEVYRFEGTVAQLLGDGVLCFFGAPVSHEDDPERAVRAALAIVGAMQGYADEVAGSFGIRNLEMRIGLNTGLVVVGKVGSTLHFEYLAVGDTVNLAARMQTAANPNTVLITEHTHRLVSTLFEVEELGELAVKGKAAPVRAYRVVGEKIGAPKRRGVVGLSSPMVGRDRELARLKGLSEDLLRQQGSVVTILGEAGLGKSRLIAEWKKSISNILWAEGRCLSFGVTVAYHLVVDLTRSLLDVPSTLPDQEMRGELRHRLRGLFGDKPELEGEVYPYLAHLLSLPLEPEEAARVKYLEPAVLQTQYVNAVRRAFHSLAQQSPVIIVCEDLHWADPPSVELLSRLLPLVTELPLLLCLVSRPDRSSPGWRLVSEARELPGVGATELYLAALSEADSRRLVANLMMTELPVSVRDLILSKAEGNPFFVEEVIGMLIDRGVLVRHGGEWLATKEIHEIEIPETLQAVLMARVDQLPEEARRTLQVASVIGREFSLPLLAKVMERQRSREALGRR